MSGHCDAMRFKRRPCVHEHDLALSERYRAYCTRCRYNTDNADERWRGLVSCYRPAKEEEVR
jgi:hypothetical protein